MIEQKEMIRAFTMEPKWIIAVLDACRYDYFTEFYDDVEKVRSPALNTPNWIQETWSAKYGATYISGTPWIARAYDYHKHFASVEHVWQYGWDDDLGTVPPENMYRAFRRNESDRMILHFMQPHMPYKDLESRELGKGPRVDKAVAKYGLDRVKQAYRNNLEWAIMQGIKPLVSTGRLIAVTADHGELLGEDGNYGHNAPDHEILRTVPWREFNNYRG